jgi:hypothetical protein
MPKLKWKIWITALISITFWWAGSVQAAFVLVDDFEGLALGSIDGQNEWRAPGDSGTVVIDPVDSNNQVLEVTTESDYLSKAAAILNGTVRMLFLRFRIANQLNFSFGMSYATRPEQFGDFESELGLRNSNNELRVNNDGTYDVLIELLPDTWYNVWMLVNNDTDTTTIWLNNIPGADAVEKDILANDDDETVFQFRSGTTAYDLRTFFIKTGGGNSQNSGPLYIDDIYLENTNALNLWNPTSCEGDFDEDGDVDGLDLLHIATNLSQTYAGYIADSDSEQNDVLGEIDIAVFAANYGRTGCLSSTDAGEVIGR